MRGAGAGRRRRRPSRLQVGVTVALAKPAATVRKCAFSPIAGEGVGVGGWGGNGHLLEAYVHTVPNPHASPKVRCAVSEI